MRKIKFRARTVKTGEWVYFTLHELEKGVEQFIWDTVCEYTGLEAKGKEIYDGDIVKAVSSDSSCVSDIICNEENDIGAWQVRHKKDAGYGLGISWCGWESLEVIGNVFENPKLIKQ